jgi:hypothetical protein
MLNQLFSTIYLVTGVVIGLGAFGHGVSVRKVHAAIDQFPIVNDMQSMLYVVWYFVSGCMFFFGLTVVFSWLRLRAGDGSLLLVSSLIGVLYVGIGAFGFVYRKGDPFMVFFFVLGALLLISGYCLGSPTAHGA